MIRDLYLEPGQLAAAQVSAPMAGEPDQPTIEFKVRLNRFQSTGATVSIAAAQQLIAELEAAVERATLDGPPPQP
ncbi:hypothetical protein ABGB18_11115 [Nonomuraea sp. B12E4]|uniref:hypothetical protein n=1 Tax=Nonomuraea sp. B12E4 TaxID=3153564 RepID=UPI00325D64AA